MLSEQNWDSQLEEFRGGREVGGKLKEGKETK